MLTTNAAKAIGLGDYGIETWKKADMVLLDCKNADTAVIDIPERLVVIKSGKIIIETCKNITFHLKTDAF